MKRNSQIVYWKLSVLLSGLPVGCGGHASAPSCFVKSIRVLSADTLTRVIDAVTGQSSAGGLASSVMLFGSIMSLMCAPPHQRPRSSHHITHDEQRETRGDDRDGCVYHLNFTLVGIGITRST